MPDDSNLRLLAAAIAARDDLRSIILPSLDRLGQRATHPETKELIQKLHGLAWKHADQLRFAIKDRAINTQTRQAREAQHLPCWTRTN